MPKSAPVSRPLKVISKEVNTKRLKRKLRKRKRKLSEAYENNENLRKELAELKDKHTKLKEDHRKLSVELEVTVDLYDTYSDMFLEMRLVAAANCQSAVGMDIINTQGKEIATLKAVNKRLMGFLGKKPDSVFAEEEEEDVIPDID